MKIFVFLSFLQVAVAFTKICPLNNAVPLEYDEVTGKFSLMESSSTSIEEKEEGGDATTEEQVRQLIAERTVRVAGSEHKRYLRARREESKSIYMARSCPCGGDEETYCLVEGISGSVHDSCGVTQSALTIFGNTTFGITRVECFKLESHTVFIRNAWPVVVFWYLALSVFLVATDNGKNVRQYVISKVCPSCRINERRLDRIMQREMEHRARILSAAARSARLAEGRGRYLLRTNGMRIPNHVPTTEGGDEAMGRWIAEAESLGIVPTPQPTEYVLQTRKFNAKREILRREQAKAKLRKANDNLGDENKEGDNASHHPSTPKKNSVKQDTASTPETVASCDDEVDEYSESEEDAPSSTKSEKITIDDNEAETCTLVGETGDTSEDDESFDCTICLAPVEDGEQVGVLPCSHIFHAECLSNWIQRRNVCPLCQATEIASPRAIEDIGDEDAGEIRSLGIVADANGNMQSSTPSTQSRIARPSQRLQLQSQSRQRRRNNNSNNFFFIHSP
ncbi:hypothetical protein ACHAWT_001212 [Skeletonema menzelii]